MSVTKNIVCLTCNESLWIGQNNVLYYGDEIIMDALRIFLLRHETASMPLISSDGSYTMPDHVLIYIHEPFEEGLREWEPEELIALDAKLDSNAER